MWWVARGSPEPVYAPSGPVITGNDAVLLRYEHYGSQEVTTADHRRMVVRVQWAIEFC
jgi:hypothetical protein